MDNAALSACTGRELNATDAVRSRLVVSLLVLLGRGSNYVYPRRLHRRARTVSERRRGVAAAAGEASDCAAGDLQYRPPSTFPSSTSLCHPQGRLPCDPPPYVGCSTSPSTLSSCTSSHAGSISLDLTRNGFEYNASLFPSDLSRRPCRASATSRFD